MRRALVTACVLVSLALPAAAHANGDPASDVLLLQDSYLPYAPKVPKQTADALNATLKKGRAAGFPLKVAIIASKNDLGAVPTYFGRPQPYADFLGREIAFNQPKLLLTVMPSGYGSSNVPAKAKAALADVDKPKSGSGDDLGRAAIDATLAMAKAAGHPLPRPQLKEGDSGGGTSPAIIFGVPVVLLALGGALAAIRARQSQSEGATTKT